MISTHMSHKELVADVLRVLATAAESHSRIEQLSERKSLQPSTSV